MIFGDISMGEVLWSLLLIFFMVVYWMIFFSIVFDLFRDHTMKGITKAVWIVFLIFLPLVSMLAYVIVRGDSMTQRSIDRAREQQIDLDNYVRNVATGAAPADQIAKAKELLDSGTISTDEYESLKQKALA
jgi:hypothetical protein